MNWRALGRWVVLIPLSLSTAFLTGTLFQFFPRNPLVAAGSGLTYVAVALSVAFVVAPSHRRIAIIILGTFILGDLVVAHLVLPTMMTESATVALAPLRAILRIDEYVGGISGIARVVGAGLGSVIVAVFVLRSRNIGAVAKASSHLGN